LNGGARSSLSEEWRFLAGNISFHCEQWIGLSLPSQVDLLGCDETFAR